MSERIFELNGLYVTSVAQPLGAGPALEFCTSPTSPDFPHNPRLNVNEVFLLFGAIQAWLDEHEGFDLSPGLDGPNR